MNDLAVKIKIQEADFDTNYENNNLIVEINEKEKEMQVNYLNIYEKAKNLLLQ